MGPGASPSQQSGAAVASAPAPGTCALRGSGGHWGDNYRPGWSLMTQQERNEHQERMRSMTNDGDCRTYVAQHREQMAVRAKKAGDKGLGQPGKDPCAGPKP